MKQTEGERNFVAPPLKTAPVFGGIAGIMTAEQGEGDDGSNMPSMSTKAQESGKLQDMYRRNLAASWAAQAGELPADECIEDIFAGGDGWRNPGPVASTVRMAGGSTEEDSDGDRKTLRGHQRNFSGGTIRQTHGRHRAKSGSGSGPIHGRTSTKQQVQLNDEETNSIKRRHEVDEFSLREDLKSWEISAGI